MKNRKTTDPATRRPGAGIGPLPPAVQNRKPAEPAYVVKKRKPTEPATRRPGAGTVPHPPAVQKGKPYDFNPFVSDFNTFVSDFNPSITSPSNQCEQQIEAFP